MSSSAHLLDRFEIRIDPDAEPTDIDEVVAEFLLAVVDIQPTSSDSRHRDQADRALLLSVAKDTRKSAEFGAFGNTDP